MKPSGDGSPPRCVISKLHNLRIELCNLIVESRKPGLKESGYGEGVHCPSLSGTNNHRCNPTNPECQRHQKIIQHLQCVKNVACFEVEVFLLPECCLKDQDCTFDEKVSSAEYLLLEKWHISYSTSFFSKPVVDVQGLLRAIRSFLHFSQLSAWLNVYQGKSPSNIHYRVQVPGDAFPAKFDCKPDVHIFPVVNVAESVCGMVRVSYRPRTSHVPIIPCIKHRVIMDIKNTELGSSVVIPLEVCSRNNSELSIEANMPNSIRLAKSRGAHFHSIKGERISLLPLKERTPYSKKQFSNQTVEEIVSEAHDCFSDIQSNSKESKTHSLSTILKSGSHLVTENTINPNSAIENVCILPSSQDSNMTKRKLSKKFHGIIKNKIRKLSDNCVSPTKNSNVLDSKNISGTQMTESKPKYSIFCDKVKNVIDREDTIKTKDGKSKSASSELRTKSQRQANTNESSIQANKRNFFSIDENRKNMINKNASQFYCQESNEFLLSPENNLSISFSSSPKSHSKLKHFQGIVDHSTGQPIIKTYATTSSHKRLQIQTLISKSRVLRDVKNTTGNVINSVADIKPVVKVENGIDEVSSSSTDQKQGVLPLPSSPIPLRKTILPVNTHVRNNKALFQEVTSCVNRFPLQPKLYKSRKLVVNFEESILNGHLKPVNIVKGFTADIAASGSFCPDHMTLPVEVYFYELGSSERGTSPYMGHVNLNELEYHVPKKGAVQVTLFNPHGTVVKMFVVNYDLSDMPPLCHTFVRQRTFYMPTSATEKDPSSGKFLRYIIHIRFASSKTGKIYLHRDFKIVVINKSDVDAASIHSQWQYELRSFVQVPTNPPFSTLS